MLRDPKTFRVVLGDKESFKDLYIGLIYFCKRSTFGTLVGVRIVSDSNSIGGVEGKARTFLFRTPFLYFVGYLDASEQDDSIRDYTWFSFVIPQYPTKPVDFPTLENAFKNFKMDPKAKVLSESASIIHSFVSGGMRYLDLRSEYFSLISGEKKSVDLRHWNEVNKEYRSILRDRGMVDFDLTLTSLFQPLSKFDFVEINKSEGRFKRKYQAPVSNLIKKLK